MPVDKEYKGTLQYRVASTKCNTCEAPKGEMGSRSINCVLQFDVKLSLPNNRTADHVLTLRTLIDKYVHCHQEKVYACFVDFRKAFDSVWHDGLLYKLLQLNVGGNFYESKRFTTILLVP